MVPKAVRNRIRPGPLLSSGLAQRSQLRCRARKLAAWAVTTRPWMPASAALASSNDRPITSSRSSPLSRCRISPSLIHAVVVGDNPELDLNTHARPKGCHCRSDYLSAGGAADHPRPPTLCHDPPENGGARFTAFTGSDLHPTWRSFRTQLRRRSRAEVQTCGRSLLRPRSQSLLTLTRSSKRFHPSSMLSCKERAP